MLLHVSSASENRHGRMPTVYVPHTATYVSSYCYTCLLILLCVLILLHVSAYVLYVSPSCHTTMYVSSYYNMCVLCSTSASLDRQRAWPRLVSPPPQASRVIWGHIHSIVKTTICVPSYYYIRVPLLYVCPFTICVSSGSLLRATTTPSTKYIVSAYYCILYMCTHTNMYVIYDYICVLMLLYMCPHAANSSA